MGIHKAFWRLAWLAAEGLLLMLPINADLFIMVYFSYQVVMHSCSAD